MSVHYSIRIQTTTALRYSDYIHALSIIVSQLLLQLKEKEETNVYSYSHTRLRRIVFYLHVLRKKRSLAVIYYTLYSTLPYSEAFCT